jgi:nitrate reductase cytochrome c-type subunit
MPREPLLIGGALLLITGLTLGQDGNPNREAVSDSELGLSKESVFGTPIPEPFGDEPGDPGEESPLPRPHPVAPPLIPHAIRDMLPITREDNLCLDCHLLEEQEEGEPTPVPESHYVDLRNSPDEVGDTPVGARYNCVTCHVAPTNAALLVKNVFDGSDESEGSFGAEEGGGS